MLQGGVFKYQFSCSMTERKVSLSSRASAYHSALDAVHSFLLRKSAAPLIVVIGPTASGKTSLSIDLCLSLAAQGIRAEVINADSRQFYRGFDIGTAKVSSDDMRGVPHHLLSVLRPEQPCNIAWFKEQVSALISSLHAQGAVPVLVGGSMLYVATVVDDLSPLSSDPSLRTELQALYDADGGIALHAELTHRDPAAARKIPRQNRVYVVRALERLRTHGVVVSAPNITSSTYDTFIVGLDPPLDILHERIARRTTAMFANGWIDEVRGLLGHGVSLDAPAMRSHGYAALARWIENGSIEVELPSIHASIVRDARRYAKRHRTWWRHDPRVHWFHLPGEY